MPQKSFCWYLRAYPHFDIILHERLIFSVLKYKIYRRQTYQERNCNYRYTKWLLLFKEPSCPWGTPPLSVKISNKPQGAYSRKWSTFIRNEEIKESTVPQKSFCWYLRAYPHFDIILHERLIFSVLKYKIYRRQTYQERNCNYRYTKWLLLFKFLFYDQISTFPF